MKVENLVSGLPKVLFPSRKLCSTFFKFSAFSRTFLSASCNLFSFLCFFASFSRSFSLACFKRAETVSGPLTWPKVVSTPERRFLMAVFLSRCCVSWTAAWTQAGMILLMHVACIDNSDSLSTITLACQAAARIRTPADNWPGAVGVAGEIMTRSSSLISISVICFRSKLISWRRCCCLYNSTSIACWTESLYRKHTKHEKKEQTWDSRGAVFSSIWIFEWMKPQNSSWSQITVNDENCKLHLDKVFSGRKILIMGW